MNADQATNINHMLAQIVLYIKGADNVLLPRLGNLEQVIYTLIFFNFSQYHLN